MQVCKRSNKRLLLAEQREEGGVGQGRTRVPGVSPHCAHVIVATAALLRARGEEAGVQEAGGRGQRTSCMTKEITSSVRGEHGKGRDLPFEGFSLTS